MNAPLKPLLAYQVQEDNEGSGGIVFARHPVVARRNGANEYNAGEFDGLTCRRAPWADRFAPGPVPILEMIRRGDWWFDCHGCGRKIHQDADEGDPENQVSDIDAVEVDGGIWCSAACRHEDLNDRNSRKLAELMEAQRLRDRLWALAPGVIFTGKDHVYVPAGQFHPVEAQIRFTFPGAAYQGWYGYSRGQEPTLEVTRHDLDAWTRWRAKCGAAKALDESILLLSQSPEVL